MLDHWLNEMTRRGDFPIAYRVVGAELLRRTEDDCGLVYCGMHVPLMTVSVRALLDLGVAPALVIAEPGNITVGARWMPAGKQDGLAAMPPGVAALLRARTVLRARGTVGSLLDERLGGPFSGNLLRLAGRLGTRVVLFWSETRPDGSVTLTYHAPPHPVCDTEEKVQANLDVLRVERTRILETFI